MRRRVAALLLAALAAFMLPGCGGDIDDTPGASYHDIHMCQAEGGTADG